MATPTWQSALSSGLTALVPVLDQHRTLRRQHDAARQGLADQARHQQDADARVQQELASVQRSTPDDERARANEGFMLALRRARQQHAGMPMVPGASSRYTMDVRHADQGLQGFGQRMADLMARIDAPHLQRRGEQESAARAGVDLNRIARDSAADDWLMRFRQANRQANPWAPLISAISGSVIDGLATREPPPPADGLTPIDLEALPKRRGMPFNPRDAMLPMPIFDPTGGR